MLSLLILSNLKGIMMGFAVAAPIGPICLLCVRTTVNEGRRLGLTIGLATAVGDAFYSAIAAFSMALVTQFLNDYTTAFRIAGGLILLYLGVEILLKYKPPKQKARRRVNRNYLKTFISTFFLTLANPMTIFAFIAFFTTFELDSNCANMACAVMMVLGVFFGAMGWWLFLVIVFGKVGKKMSDTALKWANMLSGFTIICFGLFAMASVL